MSGPDVTHRKVVKIYKHDKGSEVLFDYKKEMGLEGVVYVPFVEDTTEADNFFDVDVTYFWHLGKTDWLDAVVEARALARSLRVPCGV